jgi:hypothetical protein
MNNSDSQTKILAQALYEIRLLLPAYLGSQNTGDIAVRKAAHLAYALHNDALAIIEGKTFDAQAAIERVRAVDRMFGDNFAERFGAHSPNEA